MTRDFTLSVPRFRFVENGKALQINAQLGAI
jgi:hypothetical protein